jgi:hypothetical protein
MHLFDILLPFYFKEGNGCYKVRKEHNWNVLVSEGHAHRSKQVRDAV